MARAAAPETTLEVRNLEKSFGAHRALDRVSLQVKPGEFCALLGPSGCGKTTLLRIIAGLEFPDAGDVQFDGKDMLRSSARERPVGFVFQHYALFRHMTVFENVAFGLRVRPRATRPPNDVLRERVHDLLRLVQLEGLAERYPSQLSGGQRQRVALARTLAVEPRILLLDEPFGALDAKVRKELRSWLRDLHTELGLTSVFVTHDQEEAFALADRVVLMNGGRIEQIGTPEEVYDHPASRFVWEFLGNVNMLPARVSNGRVSVAGFNLPAPAAPPLPEGDVILYVRSHDITLCARGDGPGLPATIAGATLAGSIVRLMLTCPVGEGSPIEVELPRTSIDPNLTPGTPVRMTISRFAAFPAAHADPQLN